MNIPAYRTASLTDFISSNPRYTKPTHVLFKEEVKTSLDVFSHLLIDVFVAHKATKHTALLQAANVLGVGCDVSSLGELQSAQQIGFSRIEATGPKNDAFLHAALDSGSIISVDSLSELRRIVDYGVSAEVLLRLNSVPAAGRTLQSKPSRFGILYDLRFDAYDLVSGSSVVIRGFHVHQDGFDPGMRAGVIESLLSCIGELRALGHPGDVLNVGGAFKVSVFDTPTLWQEYVKNISSSLVSNSPVSYWGSSPYGLAVEGGVLKNRSLAEQPAHTLSIRQYLEDMFSCLTQHGVSLGQLVLESGVRLWLEPGMAAFARSACTVFPVVEVKQTVRGLFTVLDGNSFDISARMFEQLPDPILLSVSPHKPTSTFLGGLLCREDDLFMSRSVDFDAMPSCGDCVVFANTGAYATYESGNPQLHQSCDVVVWGAK